ncbi:MAG: tetratricopeptide repeat protein [Scytonema sp. PMC 1069.18]|nr:tetratricopeptide repeat protein [Scytonema sp. PMC 1069.18]MEC4881366.1 tetratricopeptide repeat protein [Scytonema sp. PMC 1070.18]
MSQKTIFPKLALGLLFLLEVNHHHTVQAQNTKSSRLDWERLQRVQNIAPVPTESLADLAVKLANTDNSEQAVALFERAIRIAEGIPNQGSKINALSAIALQLSEVGQAQRSEKLFEQAVQLTEETSPTFSKYEQEEALRNISVQIAQAGQTQRALQLAKEIPSDYRKAQALNDIAFTLIKNGQTQFAKPVLLEALQFAKGITGDYAYESNGSCANYKFDVLSKIAGNLSLMSQLETALQIANSIEGCGSAGGEATQNYQAWAFVGILNHLAKVDQVQQTWKNAQAIKSPVEKAVTWSAIAVKLIDMGETSIALDIAKKLTKEIPSPTKLDSGFKFKTYQAREDALRDIAVKLAEKQQFDAAEQIAQAMTEPAQLGLSPQDAFYLLPTPSIKDSTLVEIIRQYAKAKKVPQALQLAKKIPDVEAKALAIIAVAKELQQTGEKAQAAKLLKDIPLPPTPKKSNDYQGYMSLSHVAIALVPVGQTDRAIKIAESLGSELMKESTLTDIGVQLADMGQIEPAMKIANSLKGAGSRAIVLNKVASMLTDDGQLDRAFEVASSFQGRETTKLLADIASKFACSGKRDRALKVAETIPDDEVKAIEIAEIASVSDREKKLGLTRCTN